MEVKSLSPKQIQRLRNKHGVRVMKGSGFSVDVSDANAKKLKKAFDNKKGVTYNYPQKKWKQIKVWKVQDCLVA